MWHVLSRLEEDQFSGATLIDLVLRFKTDTMLIWYALLHSKRVIIVGTPAKQVANCCLAAPLLVHPLRGFTKLITPYVALTDLEYVLRPTYICGTTNALFQVYATCYPNVFEIDKTRMVGLLCVLPFRWCCATAKQNWWKTIKGYR